MKEGRSKDPPLFRLRRRKREYRLDYVVSATSQTELTAPILRSPIGSFSVVPSAPVTGSKKEFAIGVNNGRRHNLKRYRDFDSASESTESRRRDRARIVRAVED
jgi:hypothetical protein